MSWFNSYGIGGDPYAYLRMTAGQLEIPLTGGRIELQELRILNTFERFGEQEKAIDFAKTLNQFDRGLVSFTKDTETGLWQRIEMTKIPKVYDLDEVMPSDAMVDFENAGPELGELEAPPHPSLDYENLEVGDEIIEAEAEAEEVLTGLANVAPLAEEAIIDAEAAENYVALARQVAIAAAEAAEEITEITVSGILGSLASGVLSAAIMIGMTFGGNALLRWIAKRHLDHVKDNNPVQGATGWFLIKKMWYPMYINVVEGKKKKEHWSLYFRDLTKFWRRYTVKAGDPRIQLIKPIKKWGSSDLTPKMYINKKVVKVPFYKEFSVGTRIKRVDKTIVFIGPGPQYGTIKRGMVFTAYNIHGTNSIGQYNDRYKILLDNGVTIYLPVYKFDVYAQNFRAKTMPHHRTIPEEVKTKKARKDEVENRAHWQSTNQHEQSHKSKNPWLDRMLKEGKFEKDLQPFVTCPEVLHDRRLVTVNDELVTPTYGIGWDVFSEKKWLELRGHLAPRDLYECCGVPHLPRSLCGDQKHRGPENIFDGPPVQYRCVLDGFPEHRSVPLAQRTF